MTCLSPMRVPEKQNKTKTKNNLISKIDKMKTKVPLNIKIKIKQNIKIMMVVNNSFIKKLESFVSNKNLKKKSSFLCLMPLSFKPILSQECCRNSFPWFYKLYHKYHICVPFPCSMVCIYMHIYNGLPTVTKKKGF